MVLGRGNPAKAIAVLVLVLCFSGCVSNRAVTENDGIVLSVENAAEGILLTFENIPVETTRMFIHLSEEIPGERGNPVPVFADIRGGELARLKETGKIICPFTQNGRSYLVAVSVQVNENPDSETWLMTEITANNGIHVTNNVELKLNDTQNGVTLSAEPDFSSVVQYAPDKYRYMVTLLVNDMASIGYGETIEAGLAWQFMPQLALDLEKDNLDVSGDLPAFVTAYCNITYENLVWVVGITNTDEFTVSL